MGNIYQFTLDQFGLGNLKPKVYKPGEPLQGEPSHNYATPPTIRQKNVGSSYLDTPVFSNLEIEQGQFTAFDGSVSQWPGFRTAEGSSIDAVLFEVKMSKHIIKTSIQGRNGTVKEYISDGDYQVNIKGVLTTGDWNYPDELVANMMKVVKAPVAIKVFSWFLQQFGIYQLVIEDYSFPQLSGRTNYAPFELTCVSDTPIELLKYSDK